MDDLVIKIICTIPFALWIGFLIWECLPSNMLRRCFSDETRIAYEVEFGEEIHKLSKEIDTMSCTMFQMTELTNKLDKLSSPLVYKGACDTLPSLDDLKLHEDGDVITIGDKEYLYDNDEWVPIKTIDISESNSHWETSVSSKKLQPQICTCCGGRLDHNSICMYCGVRYG